MKFQSETNLLTAILSVVCIIASFQSGNTGVSVGACPLQLGQVCAAVKEDLEAAKETLGSFGSIINVKEIDAKCSCTNKAKSVCDTLAKDPPYNSKEICNQIKLVFLDGTMSGFINCETCSMVKNTCNLLKSCKAPADTNSNYTITSKTSTLVHPSIKASFSNEFMSSTSIIMMSSSSTTNTPINYTTHATTSTTLGVHDIHPSSALIETVIPTSSIKSGGIGSKHLFHSLVLTLCIIIVIVY